MIEKMLTVAGAGPGEVVYDLGSGSGEIVLAAARQFGARTTGIEIDSELVALSSARIAEAGIGSRARILHGDFLRADLRTATIVTLYQLPAVNELLRPLLEAQLRPGTRVVSLDFPVPSWSANRVVTAKLPNGSQHAVYLYSIGPKREVTMPSKGTYSVEQLGLELEGMSVGIARSVEGGTASADVVSEKVGPDGIVHKHLAGVKYEDITVTCGTGMSKGFYAWLSDTLERSPSRKDGAIVGADFNLVERERLSFYHGVVSEIGFPALDGASKDAAVLTVKISPEYTRRVTGGMGQLPSSGLKVQKQWLQSNFRLQIDGLDCTRVSKIDAITLRQMAAEDAVGELRDYQKETRRLEVSNLVVTVAESFAESFHQWFEDFVIKGNSGPDAEKNGTLEYLSPNLQNVHFTLTLHNLGIFKLTPLPSGQGNVRTVRAEMYCEQMSLQPGALAVSEPAATAVTSTPPASASTLSPLTYKLAAARSLALPVAAPAAEVRRAGLRFRS